MTKCRLIVFALSVALWMVVANGYLQNGTIDFVMDFPEYVARAYTALDSEAPAELKFECANLTRLPSVQDEVVVQSMGSTVSVSEVKHQCGISKICVIEDKTLEMDASLAVYALKVRNGGKVLWTDSIQLSNHQWLCAGYVAIELGGIFEMNLQNESKTGWIYIADNGALHPKLRTRAFGGVGSSLSENPTDVQPIIKVKGREMGRTWSLLDRPLTSGVSSMKLSNNPIEMGWKIGDRIAVAPTEDQSMGESQSFSITEFGNDGTISLDKVSTRFHEAREIFGNEGSVGKQYAEVINLSRNIIITGDDFSEVPCDPSLTELHPGFGTSTEGCMCTGIRQSCTVGLHTIHMHGGMSQIENVRVEKCGQRGVEGKYCLHFHLMRECPDCLHKNNAIEFSQQRGLIVHGTHNSTADSNVFYDVRGPSLYIEDGNEIFNTFSNNVAICPWKFENKGCTVPGTSNDQGDTSLNQAGIYLESPTNHLMGNRVANHFNGMLLNARNGRGAVQGKVCTKQMPLGRWEGNVFHSSGRFGTYTLHENYPVRNTGSSVASNGQTSDCNLFTENGEDNGLSTAIVYNVDYGNAFVGHYEAGDIQYKGHTSFNNLNLIYWKETKSFADGCSAHITSSSFYHGTMALPDSAGSFIIEGTTLEDVRMEANHHCGIGVTGFLCMPQYVLHDVIWRPGVRDTWVSFTHENQAGGGGIFSLSPEDAARNAAGLGIYFLPQAYQSLVSSMYPYLLQTGVCDSSSDLGLATRYENGILCKKPLRAMKIYSRGANDVVLLQVWRAENTEGAPLTEQFIPLYNVNSTIQGYKFPVVTGGAFFYRVSLNGHDIPTDWIIDFGDQTITNRWGVDEINIEIQGRECGGVIRSNHDRRFIATNVKQLFNSGLASTHGACTNYPSMLATTCPESTPGPSGPSNVAQPSQAPLRTDAPVQPSTACQGVCQGTWPYGCNDNLPDTVNYMCSPTGGCYYSSLVSDPGPSGSFCIFKGAGIATAPTNAPALAVTPSPIVSPTLAPTSSPTDACQGVCQGTWPYGCNDNLPDTVNYMCSPTGGCYYSSLVSDPGPSGSFCIFKGAGIATAPTNAPALAVTPSPIVSPTLAPTSSPTDACQGVCQGTWPYGCNDNLPDTVNYMCSPTGGCYYSSLVSDPGPSGSFCIFKGAGIATAPTNAPALAVTPSPIVSPTLAPTSSPTDACQGVCQGTWPYGCNDNLPDTVNYMCSPTGGCYYSSLASDPGPSGSFCIFKVAS